MEAFSRALKKFTVISPETLLLDFFFLLISDRLKAIYLRAYQGPSFLDAFEDCQKGTGGRTQAAGGGGTLRTHLISFPKASVPYRR